MTLTPATAPTPSASNKARDFRDAKTSPRSGTMRLLQVTDPHLFGDPAGRLMGLRTLDSFEAVLADALACEPHAHALVLTGDLVHDESPAAYQTLKRMLLATGLPCFCIPGNHDRRDLMAKVLGPMAMPRIASRRLSTWNLIFLDSVVAGREGGHLAADQIRRVDEMLAADSTPTIIFLHQHPSPIHSDWMDTMAVENGEDLLRICDRHDQLRALVFGHIHQAFELQRGGYRLLGAPSTCIQFLPGSRRFAMDSRTPGYRELALCPDGHLETRVLRIAAYPEPLQLASDGY